eukprot:jgi/Ulvmu1/9384/UM051_0011.1
MASNLRCMLRNVLMAETSSLVAASQTSASPWYTSVRSLSALTSRPASQPPTPAQPRHPQPWAHVARTGPRPASVLPLGARQSGPCAAHGSLGSAGAGSRHARRMATLQQSVDELLDKINGDPGQEEHMSALANFFTRFDGEAILLQTGVLGTLQPQASQVLRRLSEVMRSTAAQFTLQQATNALSTMTLLGVYDVPLKAALVNSVLPEIADAPPATIASLCYSLGLAGYSDHSMLRQLERIVSERRGDFEVRELAKVLWMFGRAHYNNETVAALVQHLAKRALAPAASAQDLVYGMWACGIHDTYDQELAERAVQVVPGRLGELTGGELAKLAFALVEEDVRDPALFDAIKEQAATGMAAMFPRDIAKLLYALGRAQVTDRAFVTAVKPHVIGHLDRFTNNELHMIMEAYNSWGVHDDTVAAVAQQMRKLPPEV